MHAAQFAAEFAALTGVDPATLTVIDRALAESGLRERAKGKRLPDVRLDEAVLLLLSVLSGVPARRADEGARDLARFQPLIGQRSLSLLARVLGLTKAELSALPLPEVVGQLCRLLAAGGIDRGAVVELAVEASGPAEIRLELSDDSHGSVAFTGAVDAGGSRGLRTERTVNARVLRWIGEKASA